MTSQRDSISLNYPASSVFEAAVTVLQKSNLKVQNIDREELTITAKTGISLRSWGERITVRVTPLGSEISSVRIQSKAPFQKISWGKNSNNIDSFETDLHAALKQPPSAP